MFTFNIWQGKKSMGEIYRSIFETETKAQAIERVRQELIESGAYPNDIKITWPLGQTLTELEYHIEGNYGQGWGCECVEHRYSEAKQRLKEYRENGPGAYRIKSKRVRKV